MRSYTCPTCGYIVGEERMKKKIKEYKECHICGTPYQLFKISESDIMTRLKAGKKI